MSTETTERPAALRGGITARLLDALRGLCDRIARRVEDGSGAAAVGRSTGDPWDIGYRAGRRAGYRHGTGDDADGVVHRAPYPEGSGAASQWWQGFRIGLCDGADERR